MTAFLQKLLWPYEARTFGSRGRDFRSERAARLYACLWRLATYNAPVKQVPASHGDGSRAGLWYVAISGPDTLPFRQYLVGGDHDWQDGRCRGLLGVLGLLHAPRRNPRRRLNLTQAA
jgi:hypothetical protein